MKSQLASDGINFDRSRVNLGIVFKDSGIVFGHDGIVFDSQSNDGISFGRG